MLIAARPGSAAMVQLPTPVPSKIAVSPADGMLLGFPQPFHLPAVAKLAVTALFQLQLAAPAILGNAAITSAIAPAKASERADLQSVGRSASFFIIKNGYPNI